MHPQGDQMNLLTVRPPYICNWGPATTGFKVRLLTCPGCQGSGSPVNHAFSALVPCLICPQSSAHPPISP